MNTKLSLLTFVLMAVMASSAFAGDIRPLHADPTLRSLGSLGTSTDIIKFQCGTQVGINRASAKVKDKDPVAKPIVQVQIAPWNTATSSCGSFTAAQQDNNAAANTGDGAAYSGFSLATAFVSATSGGFYCVKVSKAPGRQNGAALPTTDVGAEDYQLDHHCENSASPSTHPASIYPGTYLQNQ